MTNLNSVLEFIKNSNQSDLKIIMNATSIRKSEVNYDVKSSFRVGDTVGINHKTVSPKDSFRIIKINAKNINVQKINVGDGRVAGIIRVSPGLLVKK
jgi:hypothetical protein